MSVCWEGISLSELMNMVSTCLASGVWESRVGGWRGSPKGCLLRGNNIRTGSSRERERQWVDKDISWWTSQKQ